MREVDGVRTPKIAMVTYKKTYKYMLTEYTKLQTLLSLTPNIKKLREGKCVVILIV